MPKFSGFEEFKKDSQSNLQFSIVNTDIKDASAQPRGAARDAKPGLKDAQAGDFTLAALLTVGSQADQGQRRDHRCSGPEASHNSRLMASSSRAASSSGLKPVLWNWMTPFLSIRKVAGME